MRRPLARRADQGGAQAGIGQRLVERRAIPAFDRLGHRRAIVRTAQHLQYPRQMVRKVGVQLNPAAIARCIEAHHRIAQSRRRPAVDTQIALAAKRGQRAPHFNLDTLPATGAQAKAFGSGQSVCRDRRGGQRAHTIDRWQARVVAAERNRVERCGVAARSGPEMIKREKRCHGEWRVAVRFRGITASSLKLHPTSINLD